MKKLNSNDIAKLAGVSRSTVSRVINNYPNVPEDTRARVMKVIKENRYYPQLSGQLLSGKSNRTIGLFWISRGEIAQDSLSSNYFLSIVDAAARRNYLVLSCVVSDLQSKENINYVRRIFMEGRIDGGIFIGADLNEPLIDELISLGRIVGLFDYYCEQPEPKRITANFAKDSAGLCVDYLYEAGHRNIGFIDGDLNRLSSMQRHESYIKAMMKHRLKLHNEWFCYGGITEPEGYAAAKRMLENCRDFYPTAICANNDSVALGTYRACAELGLRIPEDISIIGIDGHERGTYSSPTLTTIAYDFRNMFGSLVDRLIDTIENKESVTPDEFYPGTLIERGSVRKIK